MAEGCQVAVSEIGVGSMAATRRLPRRGLKPTLTYFLVTSSHCNGKLLDGEHRRVPRWCPECHTALSLFGAK